MRGVSTLDTAGVVLIGEDVTAGTQRTISRTANCIGLVTPLSKVRSGHEYKNFPYRAHSSMDLNAVVSICSSLSSISAVLIPVP